ncbi:hypothetical protein Hte_008098 [Hypoxylon texense]
MAPVASASSPKPKPEYQHFVPQFIVRNFSHKYNGPKQQKGKKKDDKMYRGEPVVNNVNLQADPFSIEETKVKRILGIYDMYQDTSAPTEQQRRMEKMFGDLESRASIVFRKITKAFESKEQGVWVTRDERNLIRKFLFLLKYRSSGFHRRFYHESEEGYTANDREKFHAYMREKKVSRPIDVWFDNIKTIIELDMDPEGLWMKNLLGQMYPDDAIWFISHAQGMFMAICTPSNPGAEFILTDNSYGIFEGPNTFAKDPKTGDVIEAGWTNFHEFAPLSPKLMIILRSSLLPNPEEDGSERIRKERESQRKEAVDDWYGTDHKSSLADLPITKPRNNYSQVVNGRVELLPGSDGRLRKNDKFCFRFFPTSTEHVNRINLFLFDNAQRCRNIVFGTLDAFKKTLEWYMSTPCTYGKWVTGDAPEQRRRLLENLAALSKALGSTKEPIWMEIPDREMSELDRMNLLRLATMRIFNDLTGSSKETSPTADEADGFMRPYQRLGGSRETLIEDWDQAQRMLTLRIKIDVWSKGIPERIRGQAREWLIEDYLEGCPSRRVLLYLKRVKLMILWHDKEGRFMDTMASDQTKVEGPEDIIAEAAHNLTTRIGLNWLMYRTFTNDVDKAKDPDFDPWGRVPRGMEGMMHLATVRKFVLGVSGIAEIKELALTQEKLIRDQDLYNRREFHNPFFNDDDKIEVLTRVMKVLFEVTYPTPPIKLDV